MLKNIVLLIADLIIIGFFVALAMVFQSWWIALLSIIFIRSVRQGWDD